MVCRKETYRIICQQTVPEISHVWYLFAPENTKWLCRVDLCYVYLNVYIIFGEALRGASHRFLDLVASFRFLQLVFMYSYSVLAYQSKTCWPIAASHLQQNFWDKTMTAPYENGWFRKRYRRIWWGIVSTVRQTLETMDVKHLDHDMAQNLSWPKWFQQLQRTTCSNTASSYQQRNLATFLTRLYPGHRN